MRISQLSAMRPLLVELGGKDAAIVLEDADLDFAAGEHRFRRLFLFGQLDGG